MCDFASTNFIHIIVYMQQQQQQMKAKKKQKDASLQRSDSVQSLLSDISDDVTVSDTVVHIYSVYIELLNLYTFQYLMYVCLTVQVHVRCN